MAYNEHLWKVRIQCGILDVVDEKPLDRIPFKVVGAVKEKGIAADIDRFQLVKPGVDGRFRELSLQAVQYFIPHISDGIQKETPLSS